MQNSTEVWKPINNYEGFYEVSNLGNIRSITRYVNHWRGGKLIVKGRQIKTFKSNCGYILVSISKLSIENKFLIHRLVADAFIPNPENKPQVNHINGIKTDNRAINLEWNTRSENISHADKNKLRNLKGVNNAGSKLSEEDVKKIRTLILTSSTKDIAKMYGVGDACIRKIVTKKRWKHI